MQKIPTEGFNRSFSKDENPTTESITGIDIEGFVDRLNKVVAGESDKPEFNMLDVMDILNDTFTPQEILLIAAGTVRDAVIGRHPSPEEILSQMLQASRQ